MKNTIITIAATCLSLVSFAQNNSGTITYKETIKLDIPLEGDMAQFAAMLPKEQSFNKILHYTPEASLFVSDKKADEAAAKPGDNSIAAMITANMPEEKAYHDIKTNTTLTQRDFMSRKFLITSTDKNPWKMTGKQKKVLDFPCQQATMVQDSQEVVAWFTPAIPVATGPRGINGLPGMILEVSVGNLFTIQATKVTPGAVDKKLLVKPTEGKKMTEEQFEAVVKEKTKEMQEQYGGSGNGIQIRVDRH